MAPIPYFLKSIPPSCQTSSNVDAESILDGLDLRSSVTKIALSGRYSCEGFAQDPNDVPKFRKDHLLDLYLAYTPDEWDVEEQLPGILAACWYLHGQPIKKRATAKDPCSYSLKHEVEKFCPGNGIIPDRYIHARNSNFLIACELLRVPVRRQEIEPGWGGSVNGDVGIGAKFRKSMVLGGYGYPRLEHQPATVTVKAFVANYLH